MVWEDTTCRRATKPMFPNYRDPTLESEHNNEPTHCPSVARAQPREARTMKLERGPHLSQLEKGCAQQQRPSTA